MERNILLIHPQQQMHAACRRILAQEDFRVIAVDDPLGALTLVRQHNPCLVLTGIRMEGRDGFAVLQDVRVEAPELPVIAIAIHASIAGAVEFITSGGADYLPAPFNADQLVRAVTQALSREERPTGVERGKPVGRMRPEEPVEKILGVSAPIRRVRDRIARVAATDVHVLITGETGTGKELAARKIHALSARSERPFMIVDCAALPPSLIESEMFGHARGAFTGAERARKGLLESGDHGTVFLDEIGELELASQGRLLRLLEDGSIRRVGESVRSRIDLRFVAATNRGLEDEVNGGRFRKDLYYRLKIVEIQLPSLRERPEDIPLLVEHYYNHFKMIHKRDDLPPFNPELVPALCAYEWPGNVRELKNLLERVVVLATSAEAMAGEIAGYLAGGREKNLTTPGDFSSLMTEMSGGDAGGLAIYDKTRDGLVERFDRWYFNKLFVLHGGNISAMARQSSMTRKSIYSKLSQLKLGEKSS